jgi:hypothetical protein
VCVAWRAATAAGCARAAAVLAAAGACAGGRCPALGPWVAPAVPGGERRLRAAEPLPRVAARGFTVNPLWRRRPPRGDAAVGGGGGAGGELQGDSSAPLWQRCAGRLHGAPADGADDGAGADGLPSHGVTTAATADAAAMPQHPDVWVGVDAD